MTVRQLLSLCVYYVTDKLDRSASWNENGIPSYVGTTNIELDGGVANYQLMELLMYIDYAISTAPSGILSCHFIESDLSKQMEHMQ